MNGQTVKILREYAAFSGQNLKTLKQKYSELNAKQRKEEKERMRREMGETG